MVGLLHCSIRRKMAKVIQIFWHLDKYQGYMYAIILYTYRYREKHRKVEEIEVETERKREIKILLINGIFLQGDICGGYGFKTGKLFWTIQGATERYDYLLFS